MAAALPAWTVQPRAGELVQLLREPHALTARGEGAPHVAAGVGLR
jgi:hypothetical protein